jgi:hypothetical protein
MAQFRNKHAITNNITFSQYAVVPMQCNTMHNAQCNTMQCNTVQCNAVMYVRKSVRPYGMKSVSHFFIFFIFCRSGSMYGTRMSRMDRQVSVILSVCTNVTDGQTSFSYFSSVSVQSHTVSKSVRRTEVPTKKKKKNMATDKHKTQIRSE